MPRNSKSIALGTMIFATVAAAIACLSSSVALRVVTLIPLVFALTGYSILRAVGLRLAIFETAVLSIALSAAIVVLGGLLLNVLGALSVFGWAGLLTAITIVASLISIAVGTRREMEAPLQLLIGRPAHLAMYVAALAMGVGAVAMARAGAEQQRQYSFTELWMVAGQGSSSNLATLGVRNAEGVTTSYELALFADGTGIARRSDIVLRPSETWTDLLPLNGALAKAGRVEARLFKSNEPDTTYRKVWISNFRKSANSSSKDRE